MCIRDSNSPNTKARPIVMPTATHNTVTTNNNSPTTHVSPIVITTQKLNLPPKRFNKHNYHELTPSEIHKIPKAKFKCVGMQFADDSDPLDTATGVVTSIVRHKKSKKLVFKYWNHLIEDEEPTDPSAFEYINVDYAVRACKWSKFSSLAARIAASVMAEDVHRNLPTRRSIKRARQKARKSQIDQQLLQDGY